MKKLVQKIMLGGILGFAVQSVYTENTQLADQSVNIEERYAGVCFILDHKRDPNSYGMKMDATNVKKGFKENR